MNPTPDSTVYLLKGELGLKLTFDDDYFRRLETAKANAATDRDTNLCLHGTFVEGDKTHWNYVITPPVHIIPTAASATAVPNLLFARRRQVLPSNTAEATKKIAQADTLSGPEVLGSGAAGGVPPVAPPAPVPPKVQKPNDVVASAPNVAPPLTAPGNAPTEMFSDCPTPVSQTLIDQYLGGNDLDRPQRQRLYNEWKDIRCYVLARAFPKPGAKVVSLEQSRAIRLYLNVIVNTGGAQGATASWQPGVIKRDFDKPLPSVVNEADLKKIFDLVGSDDDLVRAEAIRFVRNLPVDFFERSFKEKRARLNESPVKLRERYAIGASFFHYNRIVEWLYAKAETDKAGIRQSINAEWNSSRAWMQDSLFEKSAKPYEAILFYAKGIVERERKLTEDQGRASFAAMLTALRAIGEGYPFNHLHVAQALAIVEGEASTEVILRQIGTSDYYQAATSVESESALTASAYTLYAGPGKNFPSKSDFRPQNGGHLLLRQGGWHLVLAKDRIGWINQEVVEVSQASLAQSQPQSQPQKEKELAFGSRRPLALVGELSIRTGRRHLQFA